MGGGRARSTDDGNRVEACGRTDVGCVRKRNEDHFLIADLSRSVEIRETNLTGDGAPSWLAGRQGTVLMVADGMGGHGNGDVASFVALDSMVRSLTTAMPWFGDAGGGHEEEIIEELRHALARCQSRLERVGTRDEIDSRLGTTLTLAWIIPPVVYVVHAGDSRCYKLHDGALHQITNDHTYAQKLRDSGVLAPDAESDLDHVLVNAVGGGTRELTAEVHRCELQEGDALLLCTDGLTRHVSTERIAEILASEPDIGACCDLLIEAAKADGGTDNVTAVVARF